jgi:hypothetical protein
MPKFHRFKLTLDIDKNDIPDVLSGGKSIQTKMTLSAGIFTNCNPTMQILGQQLADLEVAHLVVTSTKAKGAATARDAKRDIVWSSLDSERAYVQILCDNSPENALVYAELAGMAVVETGKRVKPILELILTTAPGTIRCEANASQLTGPGGGKRRSRCYLWRYTVNGAAQYTMADPTSVARTILTGLPVGATVAVQVAVKDPAGVGEWSQAVITLIH